MNDYSELKQEAEDYRDKPSAANFEALAAAAGDDQCGVLALIAENEQLKHDVSAGSAREWDLRSQVRSAKESRARVVQSNKAAREQRDQLKAENEALRKECARLAEDNRGLLEDFEGAL